MQSVSIKLKLNDLCVCVCVCQRKKLSNQNSNAIDSILIKKQSLSHRAIYVLLKNAVIEYDTKYYCFYCSQL